MVVYLDKNHPANGGVESATKLIDQSVTKGIDYSKLYLIPEMSDDNE